MRRALGGTAWGAIAAVARVELRTRWRALIGLGLAIVSDYVKDLGGEITVESRPGEGASFKVRLPRPSAR